MEITPVIDFQSGDHHMGESLYVFASLLVKEILLGKRPRTVRGRQCKLKGIYGAKGL